MEVREVASKPILSLVGDRTVQDAAQLMAEKRISSVIVTKNENVLTPLCDLGIVTEKDIIVKIVAKGRPLDTKLSEIMTQPVLCVPPEATLGQANTIMQEHHIRRILVCDHDEVVAILSIRDLLRNLRYLNAVRILHKT
jgi:CBS domain-containing protein